MADDGATVTGLDELNRLVDALPKEVTEQLRSVAQRTAFRIMERAKQLVPVDTGYTHDNIHVIEDPEHQRYMVNAGTDRPRVRFSLHRMKRSGRIHTQKVTLNMLPNWIEYGTRFQVARPFMRPAADAETERYQQESLRAAESVLAKLETV